jgi:hypothetical protein
MTKTRHILVAALLAAGFGTAGCSSNSSCADGGVCDTGGAGGIGSGAGGMGGTGPTLYALTPGTWCFEVTAIAPGYSDGCGIGLANTVSTPSMPFALPVTYDMAGQTLEIGTAGSLGIGNISNNMATLVRQGPTTDKTTPTCSWTQMDTTTVQLTAENTFNASVVENQSAFNSACTTAGITPAGGTCSSTWTWSMTITGSLNATNGCQ